MVYAFACVEYYTAVNNLWRNRRCVIVLLYFFQQNQKR